MTDQLHQDSLSELRRKIDRATCRYCRAGKPLIDGYHEWETIDGDWHGRSRVKCEQDSYITAAILPLLSRVIEQAAQFVEKNTPYLQGVGSVGIPMARHIRKMAPAFAHTELELVKLRAALEEAKWWHMQRGHHGQSWCCEHIAQLESEIAALEKSKMSSALRR